MTSGALVSVVIPTYFRNGDVSRAIRSALDQTHDPVEVVVVDDSGEGHARDAVAEFPEATYHALEENCGPQYARTVGMELSSGEFVQFLDDDDRLHPRKVERQLQEFRADDDVGVVYCGLEWEDGPVVRPKPAVRGDVLSHALQFDTAPCMIGTMLIRRDVLDRIPMTRHTHAADDIGLKIELARVTEFDYVDDVLVTRGDSDEPLGRSWAAIDGRFEVIDSYQDLYDDHPPEVRRRALAETYLVQGQRHLAERPWSLAAIGSFARAAYHIPGFHVVYVSALLLSVLGRPGHVVSETVFGRYVRGHTRRGKST